MGGEAAVELCANVIAVERADAPQGIDCLLLAVHDEAGYSVLQNLGYRAVL